MEESSLKVVFSEILRGHTVISSPKHGDVKIKHFNNFDSAELDIKNDFFYQKAVSDGLPTRKDKIDYLLKEKIWTPERNKEIVHLKSFIKGLKNSKSKVFLKAHIDQINTQINENQLKLSKMELEKEELIGFCAESYASRRINEHYMFNALCDEKNERLFTEEEFEESIKELSEYKNRLEKEVVTISQKLKMPQRKIDSIINSHQELNKVKTILSKLYKQKENTTSKLIS